MRLPPRTIGRGAHSGDLYLIIGTTTDTAGRTMLVSHTGHHLYPGNLEPLDRKEEQLAKTLTDYLTQPEVTPCHLPTTSHP